MVLALFKLESIGYLNTIGAVEYVSNQEIARATGRPKRMIDPGSAAQPPWSFFRHQFGLAWSHIKEARKHIGLMVLLFLVGLPLGFLLPERAAPLLKDLQSLSAELQGKGLAATILALFVHNGVSACLTASLGLILGIVPVLAAAANGLVMGAVFAMGREAGLLIEYVLAVIPHGAFELPASFTAWGLGFWMGAWPFRLDREERWRERAVKAIRVFIVFVVPLLLAAAVIEGTAVWVAGRLGGFEALVR